MKGRALGALPLLATLLLCSAPALAAKNSSARLHAFAAMQDWHGIWELDGSPGTLEPAAPPAGGAGRPVMRDNAPYNAEWEAKYEKILAGDYSKIAGQNTNTRYCAAGMPRVLASPFMFEIIVTPEKTWMIYTQREIRHIYTDGRQHVPEDQVIRTLWGDSIGHWENGTLVVDTTNVIPGLWLDPSAATLSDQMRIGERISMPDQDHLQDIITIEDPVALTKPWTFTRRYKRVKDFDRMIDDICGENDRNPIIDGKMTTTLE
ncbi:MAG TPA: hypothetical protein VMI92_07675 [Steroidobacteraceae bacterium]|nr:hypothetical protein [Steroidobacteraceae bacterium]